MTGAVSAGEILDADLEDLAAGIMVMDATAPGPGEITWEEALAG